MMDKTKNRMEERVKKYSRIVEGDSNAIKKKYQTINTTHHALLRFML